MSKSKPPTQNERISRVCFTDDGDGNWKCNGCDANKVQKAGTGWSNLINHLKSTHTDTYEACQACLKQGGDPSSEILKSFLGEVTETAKNIYKWLDWIISENLSFEFVERKSTQLYTKIGKVSPNTLRKYLLLLADKVKEEIKGKLPGSFGLIFDGWTLDTSSRPLGKL